MNSGSDAHEEPKETAGGIADAPSPPLPTPVTHATSAPEQRVGQTYKRRGSGAAEPIDENPIPPPTADNRAEKLHSNLANWAKRLSVIEEELHPPNPTVGQKNGNSGPAGKQKQVQEHKRASFSIEDVAQKSGDKTRRISLWEEPPTEITRPARPSPAVLPDNGQSPQDDPKQRRISLWQADDDKDKKKLDDQTSNPIMDKPDSETQSQSQSQKRKVKALLLSKAKSNPSELDAILETFPENQQLGAGNTESEAGPSKLIPDNKDAKFMEKIAGEDNNEQQIMMTTEDQSKGEKTLIEKKLSADEDEANEKVAIESKVETPVQIEDEKNTAVGTTSEESIPIKQEVTEDNVSRAIADSVLELPEENQPQSLGVTAADRSDTERIAVNSGTMGIDPQSEVDKSMNTEPRIYCTTDAAEDPFCPTKRSRKNREGIKLNVIVDVVSGYETMPCNTCDRQEEPSFVSSIISVVQEAVESVVENLFPPTDEPSSEPTGNTQQQHQQKEGEIPSKLDDSGSDNVQN